MMGAWDFGSFDNDDVSDWAWELEEAKAIGPNLVPSMSGTRKLMIFQNACSK
jgi:hypothetical protein